MNNLFLDPAARTMIVAAMLRRVERKDRILPLAAAFAVSGELGIIPGAIAASRAAKEARESKGSILPGLNDKSADDGKLIDKLIKKAEQDRAEREARKAAKELQLKQKAVEHLDQCADRFLAAIELLNPKEEQTADLITKIKEIEALLEKQKADADAAAAAAAATAAAAAASGGGAGSGSAPTGAAPTGSAAPSSSPAGQAAAASTPTPTPTPAPPAAPASQPTAIGGKTGSATRQQP